MKTFENLKSQWENQSVPGIPSDGLKHISGKMKTLRIKQLLTTGILSITVLVLLGFFFYISAYKVPVVTLGLLLMISPLAVRIGLEIFSIKSIEHIDVSANTSTYKAKIVAYYKNRVKVHFIATPIIIALYITGFILLLPSFKANLSPGFYTYILVSSILVLIVLGGLIANAIKKELTVLKQLRDSE